MTTNPDQSYNETGIDTSKIQRANIGNIVKKLRGGKTLTTSERKALDEYQIQDAGWVKDTTTLAKELGLSRQAIYDARNRFPNAPKKHADSKKENIIEWQKFCGENLIGKDTSTRNLSDLKVELMREQIRLVRAKNVREEGDVIAKEIVYEMLDIMGQKLDLLHRQKLEVELSQRVVGKTAAEIDIEGAIIVDEMRVIINSNIGTFKTEKLETVKNVEI